MDLNAVKILIVNVVEMYEVANDEDADDAEEREDDNYLYLVQNLGIKGKKIIKC